MVSEIQGLYGPVVVSETLLQGFWLSRRWNTDALRTWDGRTLRVLAPGRWNRQAGPDFIAARLQIGDAERCGDVEVHFYPEDWRAHGHCLDPAYNGVILHVCMFPPRSTARPVTTEAGAEPALLVAGPYLPADLETLTGGGAGEWEPAGADGEQGPPEAEAGAGWTDLAVARFAAKQAYQHWLTDQLGWERACHQGFLSILGMPRNRAPMLCVAELWPLARIRNEGLLAEAALAAIAGGWQASGARPENHPRRRLRQYAELVRVRPHWPEQFAASLRQLPEQTLAAAGQRRARALTALRHAWRDVLFAGIWQGPRWDTLAVDLLLPLAALALPRSDWQDIWLAWWPGDWPDAFHHAWRRSGAAALRQQRCNGWYQAMLEWRLRRHYLPRNQISRTDGSANKAGSSC
jgi:hypothetical protein